MLGAIQGRVIDDHWQGDRRFLTVLPPGGVGYVLRIPQALSHEGELLLFVDSYLSGQGAAEPRLFGFESGSERNFFRLLRTTKGVDAQTALALIETKGIQEIVTAVVTQQATKITIKGVGRVKAQNLIVSLRKTLADYAKAKNWDLGAESAVAGIEGQVREELEQLRLAFGYGQEEFDSALNSGVAAGLKDFEALSTHILSECYAA